MTEQQALALGRLLTAWSENELRSVRVQLRLSPSMLDALPSGYIAGEILDRDGKVRLAFGISAEGMVSS
jgi:hypothetical protein